ncbi:hypothetical protein SAMN05421780_10834 [Flexibacter flexilis DSM 6793]|uniref:Uncharacterized protein n=1 Tax=Flexibacter flexilis DSM 6793 TaxID=927664 RepID=A0A1I1L317_9BACT|nr:hypothetical protein [Flexibacter flexilis]SFC67429.1 hypothetical protein SAMN05421780_10834 [Flexibacter flexilis DSM 6793]
MLRFFRTLLFLFSLISIQSKAQLVDYWHRNEAQPRMDSLLGIFQNKILYVDSAEALAEIRYLEKVTKPSLELHYLAKFMEGCYYGGGLQPNIPKSLPIFLKAVRDIKPYSNKWTPELASMYVFHLQAAASHYFMQEKGMEPQAQQLYIESDSIYKKIGYDNAFGSFQVLVNIGDFYLRMKEYPVALDYLQRAAKYMDKDPWNWYKINYYNDVGLCLSRLQKHEDAIHAFEKIEPLIVRPRDSVWVGLLNGNIGEEYYTLGRLEEAEKCLLIDYQYSIRYKEICSAVNTLRTLVEISKKLHRLDKEKKYLDWGLYWSKSCNNREYLYKLLQQHSAYLYEIKDYKKALEVRIVADSLADSLSLAAQRRNIGEKAQAYEEKQKEAALKILEQEKEYATLQRNFLLFAMLAILVLAVFVFRTMRLNAQRQQGLLALQQSQLEHERQEALLELHSFRQNINQKNKLIKHFQQELLSLKSIQQQEDYDAALQQLEEPSFVTQQDWVLFSKAFEKVHPSFLQNLQKKYPQVTPAETRLLVLTKLQYSGKEIASALGVSLDAVHKSRYRLRKKLDLPEEDNFTNLIEEASGLVQI